MVDADLSWLAEDATDEVVVRSFLDAEVNPNNPLSSLYRDPASLHSGPELLALRQLMVARFDQVVQSWAVYNNISPRAFERIGIDRDSVKW